MKNPVKLGIAAAVVTVAAIIVAALVTKSSTDRPEETNPPQGSTSASTPAESEATVKLAQSQLSAVKIEPVGAYLFPVERSAVGSIDYDEDLSVQVFSPYPGKIITPFASLGDKVQKGQPLYTIESPDLIQAESTLIGAAATADLTSKELARAKELYGSNGVSERELEQATSDQQTAEGALAKRRAMRSASSARAEAEIDQIVATAQERSGAGRGQPGHRPGHGAKRAAGPAGAARKRAGALLRRRPLDQVDGGERHRKRQPAVPRRAAGPGRRDGLSRPRIRRQDFHAGRDG